PICVCPLYRATTQGCPYRSRRSRAFFARLLVRGLARGLCLLLPVPDNPLRAHLDDEVRVFHERFDGGLAPSVPDLIERRDRRQAYLPLFVLGGLDQQIQAVGNPDVAESDEGKLAALLVLVFNEQCEPVHGMLTHLAY